MKPEIRFKREDGSEYEEWESKRLGAFLDKLDTLITLHQRKCKKYKEVKESLLDKMFC